MDVSHFFIDRPRFAAVLSIIVFLVGLIALFRLPISEYPEVSPPQVVVRAQFPGANPRVIAETVSTPLEEQINGVDNLLYYDSQATSDGSMTLTATFRIGTDPIVAESEVQNRINRALPRLPEVVRQIGVTTEKSSPTLTMVVHMVSPDNRYDALYLRNYAQLYVRDPLLRISGMGSVLVFGEGDYAMRIWLDPHKLSARSVSTGEVVSAIREQNAQVAAGVVGAAPSPPGTVFTMSVNTKGRLKTEEEFADIIVRADTTDGSVIRIRDLGRVELSAGTYALRSLLDNGRRLRVDVEQVVLHGLAPGGEIEPSLVARLAAQEAYLRARERALRLLAIRPRSVEELRARLGRHGIPRSTLGAVIAELEAQGYLDDLAFARSWIAARAGPRAYGIGRLRLELRRRGVPSTVVDQAVREAAGADPDLGAAEERSALTLVERRLAAYRRLAPEQRARRIAALLSRRGFARSTIVRALKTIGGVTQVEAFDEN